jgi:hypothetical protein
VGRLRIAHRSADRALTASPAIGAVRRCVEAADDVTMSSDRQTFHGMLVPRVWIRGFFWDRVDIDRDQITLRPWLRRRRVVERSSLDAVGFEPVMLPLMWATNVRFLRTGHDVVPLLFTPTFQQRFRKALDDLGWPIVDLAPMPLRSFLRGR